MSKNKIILNLLKEIENYFNNKKDEDYMAFEDHPLSSAEDLLDDSKPAPWDHLTNNDFDEDIDIEIEEEEE